MSRLLRDVLDERSTPGPDVAYRARLSGVHARIARARRRRAATAALAVLAAVAAMTYAFTGLGSLWPGPPPIAATPPPATTPPHDAIYDFPTHYLGGRVLAAMSTTLPERKGSMVFTAESLDLMIVTMCDPGVEASFVFTVNGVDPGMGTLGCGQRWSHNTDAEAKEFWTVFGVRVGEPFTFGFEAATAAGATGKLSVALTEPVRFSELPPLTRPPVLPKLNATKGNVATVHSKPGHPLASRTIKISGHQHYDFFAQMQTPGILRVSFNGKVFMTCTKWDYGPTNADPTPADFDNGCGEERVNDGIPWPDTATVTVTAEGVTGDWLVRISD
jgi:hypothetical protein